MVTAKRCRFALASAVALALVLPAQAMAARTIGSSLASRADLFTACSDSDEPADACTVTQTAVPGADYASPVAGVITRWRVRSISLGTVTLRVLHQNEDGSFTATGSSLPQSLTTRTRGGGDASYTFSTRIPVYPGDRIALDRDRRAGGVYRTASGGATAVFVPPLADFDTATPGPGPSGVELMLNADVEPDDDGDGFGDETQDNCKSIPNDQTANPCPASEPPPQSPQGPTGPNANDNGEPAPFWRGHRSRARFRFFAYPGPSSDEFRRHGFRRTRGAAVARRPNPG
jgi:hypothetical protein